MTEGQMVARIKELEAEVEKWKAAAEAEKDVQEFFLDEYKKYADHGWSCDMKNEGVCNCGFYKSLEALGITGKRNA